MDHAAQIQLRGWNVPTFQIETFVPRKHRFAVVIPVINEGERIRQQLRAMFEIGISHQADVVVADGGSTDNSLEAEFLASVGVRTLLTKTGIGKLSAQLRCAYAWALLEGYEGIVTIDGNGKDGVEAVPKFLAALGEGVDYVQASRFITGGHSERTPLARYLAIRLIHAPIQSLAAGVWLTDTTQGFRAYSAEYLLHPGTQPFRDIFQRYELLAYLTARASQLGLCVKEVPTSRVYPATEATPTKISGFRALIDLVMVVIGVLFRVYHPRQTSSSLAPNDGEKKHAIE